MKTTTVQELVAAARRDIEEIPPQAVAARMGAGAALIDVREPTEYASGHVPGAVNIPRGVIEFEIRGNPAAGGVTAAELGSAERPIVVYCRSGGRAALAAASLRRLGFRHVASIAGGILAWEAAGNPITTEA